MSEQQYVDSDELLNMSCNGGQVKVALRCAKTNDIRTEESRAHRAKGESCQTSFCNADATSGTATGGLADEIGRASCRERV